MFNPQHPKQSPPGWPRGEERHCIPVRKLVDVSLPHSVEFYLSLSWLFSCKLSLYVVRIVMFGLPEMFLYCSTFLYIKRHNNKTARSGILPLDTIKRRKQQNKLNIMVTFWAWLAQLVTNIVYIILMLFIFGKEQFYHILLAICTICLNFNILPLFYVLTADNDLKVVLQERDLVAVLKIFLGIQNS